MENINPFGLEIIEDCSPYYIRFTHSNIEELIKESLFIFNTVQFSSSSIVTPDFSHYILSPSDGINLLSKIPMSYNMPLLENRVSYFVSQPNLYYRAHKDGRNHRFSLNYSADILDDKCVTSWYSDIDLEEYKLDEQLLKTNSSRECVDFDKTKFTPLTTMVARPGECTLFNTDIYHDWDNSISSNRRIILTLRHRDTGNVYFNDAKRILFNS